MARAETRALGSTAVDIKFRAAHSARGDQETTRCHSGTNRLLAIAESASCTSESVDRVEKMIGYDRQESGCTNNVARFDTLWLIYVCGRVDNLDLRNSPCRVVEGGLGTYALV